MDIAYLLALQNFRNGAGAFLTPFMFAMTSIAVAFPLLTIAAIIYWSYDKRLGKIILMNFAFCYALGTVFKNCFCIYRPWLKNPKIIPEQIALETAGGYSYPSLHTVRMTSCSLPIVIHTHKKHKLLCVLIILATLAVAFSRNFLGVHTPQDVLTGLFFASAMTYLSFKIDSYLEKNPNADTLFFLIASACFLLLTAFLILKPYPIDFRASKIIYSPLKARYKSYSVAGNALGFLISWYIERKFINFEIPKSPRAKIICAALGVIVFLIYYDAISMLKPLFSMPLRMFAKTAVPYPFILILWPLVIKIFFNNKAIKPKILI